MLEGAFTRTARRGAPTAWPWGAQAQSRGGTCHFVVEGQAALAASAGGAARPHGCGDCETSAANYGVAMDGHWAIQQENLEQQQRRHHTVSIQVPNCITAKQPNACRGRKK